MQEELIVPNDDIVDLDINIDDGSESIVEDNVLNQEKSLEVPNNDDVIKSLNEKITKAQQDLELERQNRIKAEAAAAQKDAVVDDSRYVLFKNTLESETREFARLNIAYKEALSMGDVDRVLELDEERDLCRSKIKDLKGGIAYLENDAAQKKAAPVQQLPSDPVEKFIAYNGMQGQSADWIRSHPDLVQSDSGIKKLQAWHAMAVGLKGLNAGSSEYYDYLNELADGGEKVDISIDRPSNSSIKKTIPSAQVTRDGNSGDSDRKSPNTVRLTAAELRYIENSGDIGITKESYARNKMLIQKRGE